MTIKTVADSLGLAHHVLRQSTSVVLFVALWSYESFPISESFARVADELNCVSSVSLVKYQVPILDVDPSRPNASISSFPWVSWRGSKLQHVVYNITADVPWFPTLRVFATDAGRIQSNQTYQGSFDERALRKFLSPFCDRAPTPGAEETSHVVLPSEMSDVLYARRPRTAKGILVFTNEDTSSDATDIWEDAIGLYSDRLAHRGEDNSAESLASKPWMVSAFEKDKYKTFMRRYDIDPHASETSTVLVDAELDKLHVMHNTRTFQEDEVVNALAAFDEQGQGIWRVSGKQEQQRGEDGGYLGLVPEWLAECSKTGTFVPIECVYDPGRCVLQNGAALSNFAAVQLNTTVLVAFLDPSCAHCQEIIPSLLTFAKRARKEGIDARLFAAMDVSTFPADVDRLVDGFPTIVLSRGADGLKTVSEYSDPLSIDAFVSLKKGSDV